MFDFGFGELLLLGVIALVVLGPERLPVAARLLGRWIRIARSQWNSVKAELENELADDDLRRSLREATDALRQSGQQLRDVHDGMADAAGQMTRVAAPAAAATSTVATSVDAMPAIPDPAKAPADESAVASSPAVSDPAQPSLFDPGPQADERPRSDG